LLFFSLALLAPAARAGDVIVVDHSGGGDYFRIQRGVDVAADGDTVLVKGGSYPGFTITDKRVYVVAETGQTVTVNGTVSVMNLAASRDVVLAGLTVQGSGHGLHLVSNAGSIRVQDCSLLASSFTGTQLCGAFVVNCSDVAFADCVLEGGVDDDLDVTGVSGSGLRATGSSIALYDCTVRGADGLDVQDYCPDDSNQGGYAGLGAWVSSSLFFASGSSFQGGQGGSARSNCGFSGDGGGGGHGLYVDGGSAANVLGCSFIGGQGGYEGCGSMGCFGFDGADGVPTASYGATLTTLPGTARKLTMQALAREWPATLPVSVQGQPGDRVFLCLSRQTAFQYVANQSGVRVTPVSPPPVVIDLGTVPGGGTLSTMIPSYELQGAVESRAYFFQTLHKLPSGQRILGTPSNLIVIDSSF